VGGEHARLDGYAGLQQFEIRSSHRFSLLTGIHQVLLLGGRFLADHGSVRAHAGRMQFISGSTGRSLSRESAKVVLQAAHSPDYAAFTKNNAHHVADAAVETCQFPRLSLGLTLTRSFSDWSVRWMP
jgi:hypothetical protein